MLEEEVFKNLLEINIKEQVIISCALNENSSMMAYSTLDETKIFVIK